ncbi:PH domain-containing protein [Natrinema altunense]|uniref:Membrane-flanked domain protein n=1 Tax=Natrinema altunense (strain JCM 12890 / CGMCC 1.3731 / AJ2) TaxID=1227494 RepID=L9ZR44_NATA2|nr:PH domain-containing protein [Natrinema altunense]ELY88541.1 membrane-flanked domain protein [Natrinema altunense JCM 12890]
MTTLHPASVAVRSLSRSLNTGFLFFVVGIVASPGGNGTNLLSVVGLVAIGIVLGIVYEFAYYRRFRYELTDDTFDVTSGVLARRDRELPLGRVQNVDIRQNVLVRVLGIAAVHIETAGGGQTEVSLQYVDEDEARRLRRQLRDGVSTDASDTDETGTAVRDTDAASAGDETVLFEIRPHELAILSVFTIDPGASLLGGIALSFASGFDPVALVPANRLGGLPGPETGLIAIAWGLLLFVLAAWLISAALTFTRYYGFRLTRVGDELYYERGLLQRYSGTIPLEKIQTLTITESIPFRWFGYAALSVETAGYAPGQSDSRGSESAIPLADADRVAELARAIEPFGPIDLESPPRRARERYAVRYLLVVAAVVGVAFLLARYTGFIRQWYVLAALAVLVPIAAHLKWRNRGVRLDDRYVLARTGFWRRTTKVVPYYRVQAVLHQATIFQRRRRLASVTADTASSASLLGRAATAHDVDTDRGLEMQAAIEDRLQERLRARQHQRTGRRWFRDGIDPTDEESATESDGEE